MSREFSEKEKSDFQTKVNAVVAEGKFDEELPDKWGGYEIIPEKFLFQQGDWEKDGIDYLIYDQRQNGDWSVQFIENSNWYFDKFTTNLK